MRCSDVETPVSGAIRWRGFGRGHGRTVRSTPSATAIVESLRMEFRRRFMSSFFSSSIRIATGYSASVISAIQAEPYKLSGAHQQNRRDGSLRLRCAKNV